jgi:hypothetical protein
MSMGAAARRQAEAFSWERCTDQTLALYSSLLARDPKQRRDNVDHVKARP